jgi:2-keto-4-pentenoate hydratase/2-oxohepta-3-ene-1,7-dioic acid hydratase in catechol pathway
MKLASFEVPTPAGPLRRLGAAHDNRIVDLAAAYAAHLERRDPGCDAPRVASLLFPPDMTWFLGSGTLGLDAARHALDAAGAVDEAFGARTRFDVDEVRLLAPLPRPRVLRDFLTFEGHMKQAFKALGRTEPISPLWYEVPAYYKGDPDTVVGPDATVPIPRYCKKFDYELELAVVIGRRGKDIAKADAHRYIAGYTIWNDFSARDQQMKEAPLGMGPSKAKDFDAGNAIGPYLVTADEISAGRQFSFEDLVAHVSQSETIHPGEVWGSGTVTGGSGLEQDRWLKAGDVIELEIEGIGVLRNTISAAHS